MQDDENKTPEGQDAAAVARRRQGTMVPSNRAYSLAGPQVEPAASHWLQGPVSIQVPAISDVQAYTEVPGSELFFIDAETDFPNTDAEFERQLAELVTLQRDRDDPDPFDAPSATPPRTPLSAFLQLRPPPFGAIFNIRCEEDCPCCGVVASGAPSCGTRPGADNRVQEPVRDVTRQHERIFDAFAGSRPVFRTGRELARAFENETPGIYHRHALNWLLYNRADVSPPRHARIWFALDLAIYGALNAAWFYKWQHPTYRFLLRPEEYDILAPGNRLRVLYDVGVSADGAGDGAARTMPTPSPGTPRHPAWPSGHSTYSAAASRMLEYFFSPATLDLPDAEVYRRAPQTTDATSISDGLWIAAQLRRLASNIGEARLWAGVHWRADHVAGQKVGRAAAQVVIDQLRKDCVPILDLPTPATEPPHPDVTAAEERARRAGCCERTDGGRPLHDEVPQVPRDPAAGLDGPLGVF
jgi:membrane-associated phospholipid phosphatase